MKNLESLIRQAENNANSLIDNYLLLKHQACRALISPTALFSAFVMGFISAPRIYKPTALKKKNHRRLHWHFISTFFKQIATFFVAKIIKRI